MRLHKANYIGGAWRDAGGERVEVVTRAATGEPLAEVRLASRADAVAAVEAAALAAPGWADVSPSERACYLRGIADALEKRSEGIARDIVNEVGMPIKLASRIQVAAPISAWRACAEQAEQREWHEVLGNSLIEQVPVGVVLAITPWNYPLHQITAKVAAALAAGCTVVLKPSEIAPLSAYALAEAVEEAGLPAGVFNLVVGDGREIGDTLVSHPGVDAVSFTGSTAVGGHVAALATGLIKRVSLELGGKSAAIVLDGADLQLAVKNTVASCFLNSGQTCSAITRLLVPEQSYDAVAAMARDLAAAMVVGDPLDPAVRMGPLVSAAQRQRVLDFIAEGVADGAQLLAGGAETGASQAAGFFVQPTVFGRVDPGSRLAREEVFGPVLSIITYADEEEAIAIANGTGYGLAGAVWAAEEADALRVARRMRAGQIDINGGPFNLQAPFGGFGRSGFGRENGRFGIEEFIELRAIQRRPQASAP